tara:strand:+ start:1425 stop:2633 length:1209 start_codon:yes stop_codon:yes gene_type:complete
MDLTFLTYISNKDRIKVLEDIKQYNKHYELFKFAKDTKTGLFILPNSYDPKNNTLICSDIKCLKKVMCCSRWSNKNHSYIKFFRHYPSKEKNKCENFMLISKDKEKLNDIGKIITTLENIHTSAINIIYHYLLAKKTIIINTICVFNYKDFCSTTNTTNIYLEDGDILKKEYSFKWQNNDYRADIAILDKNNNLKYIIEVAHTHLTQEHKRPDNIFWCEINASSVCDEVVKREEKVSRTDFNAKKEIHIISYYCIKKTHCIKCYEENLRLKIIDDQRAINILQIEMRQQELKEEKQIKLKFFCKYKQLLREKYETVARVKEEKEEKHRVFVQKIFKKVIIEKQLICSCCNKDIVSKGYKWFYIENKKSNIVICMMCYYTIDTYNFKNLYSELYDKEYKRLNS